MQGRNTVGTRTLWVIAVMLPVAVLTRTVVPWHWGFPAIYLVVAFLLQVLVRMRDDHVERLVHIAVISGSGPFVFRSFFGETWHTATGFAHVVSVSCIAIVLGYWLASRVRPVGASSRLA